MNGEKSILEMTPKRKIDLWKKDDSNPELPLIIMGYGAWIKVNRVGDMIWEQCTGATTVSEIIEALCRTYPSAPKTQIEQDVMEFLQEFDKKGLLVLNYDPLAF